MPDDSPTGLDVEPAPEDALAKQNGAAFPVVGIGASAGGLIALQELLGALPVDTGMGFVVVQHLAPEHASSLAEILSRTTTMPVREVGDEPAVEPDHVYVIPPGRDMIVAEGKLVLLPQQRHTAHRGIDRFFRSLAEDSAHLAVGVVLSGSLSDGTVGLEEIKAAGGVTFAQDDSAQHESMPRSAVASGCVDFVLPPEKIAQELARIARHSYIAGTAKDDENSGHGNIVEMVRGATGVDFTHYKSSTLRRRITRRMMLHRLDAPRDYEEHLRQTPDEIEELFQDILISVTSFFRDPESFEALARDVFPKLIAACPPGEPVRLWVAGCSSGEEAYSLAMVFTECAEAAGSTARLQLFATDVNPRCVEKARAGWYPRSTAQEVTPERLRRFFTEEGGGYRVRKALREHCIFSRHNLLTDPPFSRVDFISCRNLLIYLEGILQQRVMHVFHYALKPNGCLWLGSSESVGTARTMFEAGDLRHKTFTRRPGGGTMPVLRAVTRATGHFSPEITARRQPGHGALHRDAERLLLAKYSPPGVVVSAALDIVQFQGDTSPYLAPASGVASHHLLKMLREGLAGGVREALQRAEQQGQPVRTEGLRVRINGGFLPLAVEIIPITSGADRSGGFIVLFDGGRRPEVSKGLGAWWKKFRAGRGAATSVRDQELLQLTRELDATRESLQAVSEQHEAVAEELRSANEEAQSANEEMQSVNEELETSKEEMEATNEELATLNEELAQRNVELSRLAEELRVARDYSESIVANARVPLVVLDGALNVKSTNQAFYDRFRVAPGETEGRRIYDLGNRQWDIPALRVLLEEVLPKTRIIENYEVRHDFENIGPRVMLLNASRLPQGANNEPLITLSIEDITDRATSSEARARLAAIVESSDDAIVGKNLDGIITSWNRAAENLFGYTAEEIIGQPVTVLIPDDRQDEEAGIIGHIRKGEPIRHFETVRRRKDGTLFDVSLSASPIKDEDGKIVGASKIARDVSRQKAAEQALHESEERFRLMANAISQLAWTARPDGHLDWYNQRWYDYTGTTPEAMEGWGWQSVHDPVELPKVLERWKAAIASGEPFDMTFPLRGADGIFRLFLTRGSPLKNAAGDVIQWFGTNTDVDEIKRTEGALRHSEQRFRTAASVVSSIIWTNTAEGKMEGDQPGWGNFTGQTREEYREFGWAKAVHPEDAQATVDAWNEAVAEKRMFVFEHRVRRADGAWRLCSIRAVPMKGDDGEILEWVGVHTDITEAREAFAALRTSEEFKRSIIESSPDCIKVLDLEGNLLSLEAGQELLGIPDVAPFLGTCWIDFWSNEEDRAAAFDTVTAAAAGEEGHFIGFFRTLHGYDKWWDVAISPIMGPDGRPVRLLAVSRDVTEQREMEDMLVARAEALAKADRSKDEFLAMLAHELRNPLASLHNAAGVLHAEGAGTAQRDHAQLVLARQTENMSRMIDDLLDVSRITEGKIELRKSPVELENVLVSATNLARSGFAARAQEMTLTLPPEPMYLDADSTRLEQVFGNLLTNACKYGGDGCKIELIAERAGREVIVTVRDNGAGIAPDLLPRVFELFVQSSRTLDRAHGGLGIGLTLVRRLVNLHGGSVEARSEGIGRGSEFIVRLPVLESAPVESSAAPASNEPGRSFRMLIVDDNIDAAESLGVLQELLGHTTRVAHTGPAGLALAADFLPEVVLLDIGLPGMDGYEVARQLRTMPTLESVILIAMSGYGRDEDRAKATLAGVDEYFVKPVDLDRLRDYLRAPGKT